MSQIKQVEIILYVADQERSTAFYRKLLRLSPVLHVPGMTEFQLSDNCRLGLMPNDGIARILEGKMPHPDNGTGIPRCELYLSVSDIRREYENALLSGAKLISPVSERDWGDHVCYFSDPDGHIIAFAQKISNNPLSG
jgi:catechol 2,3-dioxygenase-like lactoylglutathione lyase family enzyme